MGDGPNPTPDLAGSQTECTSVSLPLAPIVVLMIARIVMALMALAEYFLGITNGSLEHAACSTPEDLSGHLRRLPGWHCTTLNPA